MKKIEAIIRNFKLEEVKNFGAMFQGIDQNKDKLNIQDYGISITTLEEVFLTVASGGKNIINKNFAQFLFIFPDIEKVMNKKQDRSNKILMK